MSEFDIREELRVKRRNIETFEDLTTFLKDVEENYNVGYGSAPRAIAQATAAVAWYLASKFGITGFQAGFVMWDFIRDWMYTNNKCGLKIIDYDNMLYPQYGDRFEKIITDDTWNGLQEQAKKNLEEYENGRSAHPEVVAHWKSIVDGTIPFGYRLK